MSVAGGSDRETLRPMLRSAGFRLSSEQGPIRTSTTGIAAQRTMSIAQGARHRTPEGRRTSHPLAQTLSVMRGRFFTLLEKHRVPLTVVPTLLSDFSVKTSMLEDEGALTDVLTDGVLEYLAGMFYVHPSWLRDPPHAWRLSLYPRGTKLPSLLPLCRRGMQDQPACACAFHPHRKPKVRLRGILGASFLDLGDHH